MARIIATTIITLFWLNGFSQLLDNGTSGFTRKDTLRGALSPLRVCYDVIHYDLNLKVEPGKQYISGYNTITYRTVADFKTLQIDLFEEMEIDRIFQGNSDLEFEREENAVFVHFPTMQQKGRLDNITVYFSGHPIVAKKAPWDGGFVWHEDSLGKDWIGTAVQGVGASLWWPNKDHLSDEPETMNISVAVPNHLECVSNGQLQSIVPIDSTYDMYNWYVSYPINNYNVTLNIAEYTHFNDWYVKDGDSLALDYYVLPYNLDKAKEHFKQVKPMLEAFEHYFGPYPFPRDGFALVETPYLGMEHQSAIAYGNKYMEGYLGHKQAGMPFDYIIIHEAGHEWWGNSVSVADIADLWIHEGFCTYAEALYVEYFNGYEKAVEYINYNKNRIRNKEPIIGVYGVNNEGSSDMYSKGSLMLNTLRSVLNNDSLWFAIIKGIATDFKHDIVNTEMIVKYINERAGKDFTYFFDQYLRYPEIPKLTYSLEPSGKNLKVRYRWTDVQPDFRMPVKVSGNRGARQMIFPTAKWQEITFTKLKPQDFAVDTGHFYIKTKRGEKEEN